MLTGMLVFSGTCYIYALTERKDVIRFTPYSGTPQNWPPPYFRLMLDTGNFQLVASATGDGEIEVRFFKSSATGMTVAIVNIEGPVVNGYFCIATEAHDDDGLPHTLEHLIFLGSDDYPFKGVLDLMANRCFADGTNACTDTDFTYYTLSTAGSEGFLNILPVYLEHILFPKLTDAAFTTEVHHINAKGEDAGVVYSEMQSEENTGESLTNFKRLELLYPGRCGYKSDFGGKMKNLRESTTNEKIRAYHRVYYRPENLCVIICGEVEPVAVFKSLESLESKIISRRNPEPFERPWQTPVEPLPATVETTIQYPSDDDNNGIVSIAWRGPLANKEYELLIALSLLTDYLNDTAISPLQQEFVERDDPYCSGIEINVIKNYESCIEIRFDSVEKEKRHAVKDMLFEVLKKIENRQTPIDMNRMVNVIHRKKMQHLSMLETAPHKPLAMLVLNYFLYGNKKEDLLIRMRQIPVLDQLMMKDEQFWIDLLNRYFLSDVKHVVVVAEPSPEKLKEMTKEEEQRLQNRCKALGEEGLKQKGIELEEAIKNNEIEPPKSMINSVPVPEVENIYFHSIKRINNYSNNHGDVSEFTYLSKIPFRFQLDDVKTNFVTMRLLIDTSNCLSSYQRLFLPLWSELVMESQIVRDGIVISYEDVIKQIQTDTVDNNVSIGWNEAPYYIFGSNTFSQVVMLMVKVELENYEKGICWLSELMFSTQFTVERIKTVAKRMISDIAQNKRIGYRVAWAIIKSMCFQSDSNHWAVGFDRQNKFLTELVKKLESSPEEVVNELEKMRLLITDPANLTVHMSANVSSLNEKYPNAGQLWIEFFLPANIRKEPVSGPMKVVPCSCYLVKENSIGSMVPRGFIAGVGSVESSYLNLCTESVLSWTHPDVVPLLVLLKYLSQFEGPMWRQIRGTGLSYFGGVYYRITEGLLYFQLGAASQLVAAFQEGLKIVKNHLSGDEPYQQLLLESARSSLIYSLIQREKSVDDLSFESMFCYLRGVDINYNKELINSVSRVSISDLKRVGPVYLKSLFDPTKSRISICCHPSKVVETIDGFKDFGFELNQINTEEENFMSNIVIQ